MKKILGKTDVRIFLSLLLYATAILFVVSPDSYTHDLYARCDTAIFFTSGKAWMNGMVPYVDFADSKGPLLWLIYGLGYLLSHYNYVGVFWISCFWYSATFFILYKIGTLLTGTRRQGYAVSLLMALPLFCTLFHYEIRAEDWSYPFIALSLYVLLRRILRPTSPSALKDGVVLGFSIMAVLLIKWSIAVMMLSFVGSVFLLLVLRKQGVGSYCIGVILGALVTFAPFGIYMLATNSFSAFIYEYFINTAKTVDYGLYWTLVKYYHEWIYLLTTVRFLYVVYVGVILLCFFKWRNITLFPFLCALFFLAISIHHDSYYYITAVSIFAIFLVALLVKRLRRFDLTGKRLMLVYVVSMLINFCNIFDHVNMFWQHETRKDFYDVAYLLSQREKPKVLLYGHERGLMCPVDALPATRYWTPQVGATKEMKEERIESLVSHNPDFVIVSDNEDDKVCPSKIIEAGYQYYMNFHMVVYDLKFMDTKNSKAGGFLRKYYIYGPKGLKMPSKDFQVSDKEILLKSKIF